ncbi:hypothetical protein SG34_020060 [Thalassomonas viridans]|uniref:Uncharacterized protein n=1 Tax=Thalassomonas viridans TaxID=137584 RepID=A0AAF0C7G1_9GAMM|nr:hypothetical protein [Thalassomonas viridans]WDE03658.1 hypothetical protein SG34_020060 [Thalassomonas viridans]
MKIYVLMTLLKTLTPTKNRRLSKNNQQLKHEHLNKNETEGNGELSLNAYAAMGVLQLI